jgi:hypothetical protein
MRSKLLAAGLAVLLISSPLDSAEAVTVEGGLSPELKAEAEAWLEQNLPQLGDARFVFDESLDIQEGDDGVITLATTGGHLVTEGGEATIVFGAFEGRLTPRGDGWYDSQWKLPPNYEIYDQLEQLAAQITIGKQQLQGVWAPEYQNFMSFDYTAESVALKGPDQRAAMLVDGVTLVGETVPNGRQLHDSRGHFSLSGLAMNDPDSNVQVLLGGIEAVAEMNDMDLVGYIAWNKALADLETRLSSVPQDQLPPETLAELQVLVTQAAGLVGGSTGTFRMLDLRVVSDVSDVVIKELAFGGGVSGLSGGTGNLQLDGRLDSLSVKPALSFDPLLPRQASYRMGINNFPYTQLITSMFNMAQLPDGSDPDAMTTMGLMELQGSLTSAGSTFEIQEAHLATDTIEADLSGDMRPDLNSPFGAVADFTLIVSGIHQAMTALQGVEGAEDSIMFLGMLQGFGLAEVDAEGNNRMRYDFRLTPQGQLLLNGVDMMMLMAPPADSGQAPAQ